MRPESMGDCTDVGGDETGAHQVPDALCLQLQLPRWQIDSGAMLASMIGLGRAMHRGVRTNVLQPQTAATAKLDCIALRAVG